MSQGQFSHKPYSNTGRLVHNRQHHSCSQPEAVLKQHTLSYSLIFPHTVSIPGKQFLLGICHGYQKLNFIPADQLEHFLLCIDDIIVVEE
jgi:hypothetical protein